MKISMTGKQLLDALNKPRGNEKTGDCIYAFSGFKCTVAPWNEQGTRYLSVTLADGTPIDENKLYTVACWDGTVFDEFITETLETYEGTFEELLTAKLKASSPISPVRDGRITIRWQPEG